MCSGQKWKISRATGQTNLTDRMEDCTIGQVQLCEHESQTLEAFVAASHLSAKFDCPVAHHNFSFLATVHDYEISFIVYAEMTVFLFVVCCCFVCGFLPPPLFFFTP